MKSTCSCCGGIEILTPSPTANRPGLPMLSYRVGTHASFLETMLARLSSADFPELAGLKTRDAADPAIALLDGWALVADVLTFYQERIANEGYLRTAMERRSILELARLIGYTLRPGVASTVFLAYTLDKPLNIPILQNNATADNKVADPLVTIPVGSRAQSVPGPGELPQSFETSDELEARSEWNNLQVSRTHPQNITLERAQIVNWIYFTGTALNLKKNDNLLLVFGEEVGDRVLRTVEEATPQSEENRTDVRLRRVPFLVIAAVKLLRVASAAVDKQLKSAIDPDLAEFLEVVRKFILLFLENLLLGNYPPIHREYFSHDRFYRWFANLLGPKVAMAAAVGPAIRRAFSFGRSTGTIRRADAGGSDNQVWKDPQVLAAAADVLDELVHMLKDDSFRRDIICLGTDIVNLLRPVSTTEKDNLEKLLNRISSKTVTQFNKTLGELKEPLAKVGMEKLVGALKQLFHDGELHKGLEGLLKELSELKLSDDSVDVGKAITAAQKWLTSIPADAKTSCAPDPPVTTSVSQLIEPLVKAPSLQPASSAKLVRTTAGVLSPSADNLPRLLVGFQSRLRGTLYQALGNAAVNVSSAPLKSVHVFRLVTSPFGYNAPVKMALTPNPDDATKVQFPFLSEPHGDWDPDDPKDEEKGRLFLDGAYEAILPQSFLMIQNKRTGHIALRVDSAKIRPRTAYTVSAKTTQLSLSRDWWKAALDTMDMLRNTTVYGQSEELALAREPFQEDVHGDVIEMDALYDGLTSGRWLIVFGERTDISGTSGVRAGELVMLAGIEQKFDPKLPGDKTHTYITLAKELSYRYKRDTVVIYGNVVKATHGETRNEVLGSGDGSKALQQFALRQPPLTFVSAANPTGVDSTLVIRVNDIQWLEAASLAGLAPKDRKFITKTDDDGKTTVIFGNGWRGARLPTGQENVKAVYRNGIGKPGNVKADQVTLLASRPLGVKAVTNPLRASGGADKENRDQARKNAPLAVTALDRLVGTQDYADFARTFAGIGKASAVRLPDGQRQVVFVTIAGADDIPIEKSSDLYLNLRKALHDFGDPYLAIQVELRELLALVISASVRIKPDYLWESVEAKIRSTLSDVFGFESRELGQTVYLSEVISAIQKVAGVEYVDVDLLGSISELDLSTPTKLKEKLDELTTTTKPQPYLAVHPAVSTSGEITRAQLAFLMPGVPDTLILRQVSR